MKGDAKVIEYLNKGVRHELAAINQYWLHYRLFEHWGFASLAKQWRKESIEEMQHADKLVARILFLDGFPLPWRQGLCHPRPVREHPEGRGTPHRLPRDPARPHREARYPAVLAAPYWRDQRRLIARGQAAPTAACGACFGTFMAAARSSRNARFRCLIHTFQLIHNHFPPERSMIAASRTVVARRGERGLYAWMGAAFCARNGTSVPQPWLACRRAGVPLADRLHRRL